MTRRSRTLRAVLLCGLLCALLVGTGQAARGGPSSEEIEKMEQAMPEKPLVPPAGPRKMLVVNLCQGFKHSSVPFWDKALQIMGEKTGAFSVTITSDLADLNADNLKQYDAVCFNNTTQLKLSPKDTPDLCSSLMDFVKGGKGVVGIHAATDNFPAWPEGREMMGGKFTGHPWGGGGTWAVKIDEPDHPLTVHFEGKSFKIKDEMYRIDPPLYSRSKQLVLMSLDMSDPTTRNVRGFKPTDVDTGISWVKKWGKGRVFYCSLGHDHAVTWNKPVLKHFLAGIQFALGDLKIDTTPKPAVSSEKGSEMDELFAKVKKYDFGQSRLALTELSDKIREAYGKAAELSAIEKGLVGVLESDATYAGKQYVCRELGIMGTGQSVPALSKMLVDEKLSDMARYALERMPGRRVNRALLGALGKTSGKIRVGIINTLGERQVAAAVAPVGKLVDAGDAMTSAAAISALGKIGGSDAATILAQAAKSSSGVKKMRVFDAYLKCADKFAAKGNKAKALAIYRELYKSDNQLIRTAAMRGMVGAAGKNR